ncbi:hypothetical protein E9993_08030 [Labilibacter sediminis]|nr:hypothetical protein E9993_08030 [Labilibacter sediminis]
MMLKNDKDIQRILRYLSGNMTNKDRYVFERSMEADPFLKDAVEGYEKMSVDEIESTLITLRDKLNKNRSSHITLWIRVAAVSILVLGIGSLLFIGEKGNKEVFVADDLELIQNKEVEGDDSALANEVKADDKMFAIVDSAPKAKTAHSSQMNESHTLEASKMIDEKREVKRKVSNDVVVHKEMSVAMADKSHLAEGYEVMLEAEEVIMIRGVSSFNDMVIYKGKVIDEEGFPLAGVNVVDQGTLKGTITDMEGNFEINIPQQRKSSLAFSSLGFKSQNVTPEGDSLGEVVMESEDMAMDEMVVVGYGVTKKKDLTGAAQRAKSSIDSISEVLLPEPKIGIKRFVRKIERSLDYPFTEKNDSIKIKVEIFVSIYGEVEDIHIKTEIDEAFAASLKKEIASVTQWIPPQKNNDPMASSREVEFLFD